MDQFVLLSDMLINSGQLQRKDFVNPLTDQLKRYRNTVNDKMQFVCVDLAGTGMSITNQNEDTGDERDVLFYK